MARLGRYFVPAQPPHVIQCGNDRGISTLTPNLRLDLRIILGLAGSRMSTTQTSTSTRHTTTSRVLESQTHGYRSIFRTILANLVDLRDTTMSGYWELRRSSSNCVHFVYVDEVDDADRPILNELNKAGIKYIYVDYLEVKRSDQHIANVIAQLLKLQHAPYQLPTSPKQIDVWVPFWDDLITLSHHENGIAIIIDNADAFLSENSRTMFKLIEAFMVPFHHWLENNKPCHLCFQMEKSEWVRAIFASA
jgi:hypothetical protein